MASLCLSSVANSFVLRRNDNNKSYLCAAQNPRYLWKPSCSRVSSSLSLNPLRISTKRNEMISKNRKGRLGAVCYAGPLFTRNLQWISTISSVVLMFAKGTSIRKTFLVPLFALQAPFHGLSKGDYGIWTAFLVFLVRLFFFIPGELELPFVALLLVLLAPYQVMNLRGTQEGAIISLAVAAYLAFQHFSWVGNLQKAFDQGSIVATLSIICITILSMLFLI